MASILTTKVERVCSSVTMVSPTRKMEGVNFYETFVTTYWTTRHNPEDHSTNEVMLL
jgi:hypothetical protein